MRISGFLLAFVLSALITTTASALPKEPPRDFKHVITRLKARKVPSRFIAEARAAAGLPDYDKWVKPNVFGFRIRPDYSGHISPVALSRTREFLERNQTILLYAKAQHGVAPEVIAALLWVETKLGTHTGSAPVVTVLMNLAMADHPRVLARMQNILKEEIGTSDPEFLKFRKKLRESSERKAKWAIDQLVALSKISRRNKRLHVFSLKGSYAGAFGMAQFIPESYLSWAKAEKKGTHPDLFDAPDAILSVAYYLKRHGWKPKDSKSWTKALYGYNRSDDYGRTILEIAAMLGFNGKPEKRKEADPSQQAVPTEEPASRPTDG